MVKDLLELSDFVEVCIGCMKGKQHDDSIPKKSQWRATQNLQLIHADICIPITLASNSNKWYILCLLDYYSRKALIYFLSQKSEAFYFFKCFKALMEKETSLPAKCLHTDRGW